MTDVCVVCGEPVTTRTQVEAVSGWQNVGTGEFLEGVALVVHPECYMRLTPAEWQAVLDQATEAELDRARRARGRPDAG